MKWTNTCIHVYNKENDQHRVQSNELIIFNNIFKKKLASNEEKKVYIQNYQCCEFTYKSCDMEKMIEHMTENHKDIKKEEYVESSELSVEICYVCHKLFYSQEDLVKHNQVEIYCPSCGLCTTAETSDFDFCTAMEHFGDWKLDDVIKKLST